MSEGRQMKWVIDNLGITRETIKYYDSKGLISPHREPSSNNRRIFDEDDLEDLWTVKLLMETGFSSGEILAMQRGELDFAKSIGDKVDQLERDIESKQIALSFVKTIKLTGQIPSLKNMGDMTFQDFFEYSQSNWNFANDKSLAAIKKMADSLDPLKQSGTEGFTEDDVNRLVDFFESFGTMDEVAIQGIRIDALAGLLPLMKDLEPSSEAVQIVLAALFGIVTRLAPENPTEDQFARCYSWSWDDCDLGQRNRSLYGAEACDFVLASLAAFGARSRK